MYNISACLLFIDKDIVIYFGIDTIKDVEDLNFLVHHEINHYIRDLSSIKHMNFKIERFKIFKERMVRKVLGVFTPFRLLENEEKVKWSKLVQQL